MNDPLVRALLVSEITEWIAKKYKLDMLHGREHYDIVVLSMDITWKDTPGRRPCHDDALVTFRGSIWTKGDKTLLLVPNINHTIPLVDLVR